MAQMNEFEGWLIKHNSPENVRQLLLDASFPFGEKIGSVRFGTVERIMEYNTLHLWPNMFENKLLIVGTAINGDAWAIHYKQESPTIVILPFDDMPSNEEKVIPETIMEKVADSFHEFIALAKENLLPLDYYDAKERKKS